MKNTRAKHSKFAVIYVCFILLFTASSSYAEPEQRFIIHFKRAISNQNIIDINKLLSQHLAGGYKLTEHSNNLRWIIILNTRLDSTQQNIVKGELLKNPLIKNIEVDKLLLKKITIQAQLLPL